MERGGVPTLTRESRLEPKEKALASAEQMLGTCGACGGPPPQWALGTLWENGSERPHFSAGWGDRGLGPLSCPPECRLAGPGAPAPLPPADPVPWPPQPTTPAGPAFPLLCLLRHDALECFSIYGTASACGSH